MTAWATLTLKIEKPERYDEKQTPTSLILDSGIDEQGWIDEDTYYALSFGRYQEEALRRHVEEFHSPIFSGIKMAQVASVEDTGDSVELDVYLPKQRWSEERVDGFEKIQEHEGSRFPDEKREEFKEEIESLTKLEPVIEAREKITPPDMVLRMNDS